MTELRKPMIGLKKAGMKWNVSGLACLWAVFLCICFCMPAVTASAEAANESAGKTWEERLELARKKYNGKTVNVFEKGHGWKRSGKINVQFIYSSKAPYEYIEIHESLTITDEADMQAILEVVTADERYSEEDYGSIAFMKAVWIAHNIAHSMTTGTEEERNLVEAIAGESLTMIRKRAKVLDLEPIRYVSRKELLVYEVIKFVYGLDRH